MDDEIDLYETRDGSVAYADYTVYVDVGEAQDKFVAFIESLGDAVEYDYHDRSWK